MTLFLQIVAFIFHYYTATVATVNNLLITQAHLGTLHHLTISQYGGNWLTHLYTHKIFRITVDILRNCTNKVWTNMYIKKLTFKNKHEYMNVLKTIDKNTILNIT